MDTRLDRIELLDMVELDGGFASRYPHEVSGGQCQRAAIARDLAPNPQLMICDEATSALDVTVQAQILDLFLELRKTTGMSIVLVTHNPGVAAGTADRVALMKDGELMGIGDVEEIFEKRIHNQNFV